MTAKEVKNRDFLLAEANRMLQAHEDYLAGIYVDDVEQKGDVLVFKGNYFLDHNGLPTLKSAAVFNLFKYLAHELSQRYRLES